MFRHGVAFVRNSRVIHRLPVVRHLGARKERAPGATSEELQQVLGNWSLHRGKNSSDAQIMRPIQERGRFCCRFAGLGGRALKKYASISGRESKFQERFASSELFRPRKTQNAACKSTCQSFTEPSYPANRR